MAETPRTQFETAGHGRPRSWTPQQWGALIGGGALAIYGITRRSPLGIALAAGGGTLALLGARRKPSENNTATTSLLINTTPQEAYRFWRDFQNLPRFMNRLQNVTVLDNRRSRWTAAGPGGKPVTWEAEITEERENEMIAWRSLPGSDIEVDGRVEFQQAPAGRGTLIKVRLQFAPPFGTSGTIAKFLNKGASFVLRQDMRRLEALMEAGEIPTTAGQPHGRRDLVTGLMRAADPTRPLPRGTNLTDALAAGRRSA
ncbi:MAG TPA: SRPBCC family protein [Candidatus Sulfotelmatobacter sp.]|nr:SRPBCC family protein [Candidatus Sulfotelmatobacter sp.]